MARKPTYLADFDSAMGMLRALSSALHGRDFPLLGTLPSWTERPMRAVGALVNRLPKRVREQVYIWSGWFEAISTRRLDRVDADAVAEWITGLYPKRRYPAIAIGSANGAATHLWAALAIPWLPQTVLVPVARSGVHPDEPQRELQWAAKPSRVILERNPDMQLHHMHDPVQDRLMVQRMSYFRFKRRVLGAAYERFWKNAWNPAGRSSSSNAGCPGRSRSAASDACFNSAPSGARPLRRCSTADRASAIICIGIDRIGGAGSLRPLIGRRRKPSGDLSRRYAATFCGSRHDAAGESAGFSSTTPRI
jgi:hypothetical protein